jgi:hypothetical protein
MRVRIGIWTLAGALVVDFWWVYISATMSNPHGMSSFWLCLTCPVALARRRVLSIYSVLLANAATYALIGTIVEMMRRHYKQARLISN